MRLDRNGHPLCVGDVVQASKRRSSYIDKGFPDPVFGRIEAFDDVNGRRYARLREVCCPDGHPCKGWMFSVYLTEMELAEQGLFGEPYIGGGV